ncbi:glycoside hydrolase family 88/105 protein [Reichenbachiella ulvae]|uniref:Glycoside hydrolase family 88 protein n=1 Tax=Reichenbachiella ulvae TaxID=2980104 RepID=A0ABT3CV47_9BACT|nr:glycoside hydrolase family 88 protein [Reichenbachiella ulvae]MCV9387345.1 glycoside hydrolase family 88 protein [Reichenbachiella ulvae]
MLKKINSFILMLAIASAFTTVQAQKANDVNTPLHLSKPDYDTPYGIPSEESIVATLDRVYEYLESTTPSVVIDLGTGEKIEKINKIKSDQKIAFEQGDFRPVSYEWGVTYAGMLLASQNTDDPKYAKYTLDRMNLLAELYPQVMKLEQKQSGFRHPIRSVLHPHALDDAGAMCAAMIKSKDYGFEGELDPMITNYMDYISNKELRLEDGTLARNRPMKNSLWLDDLFMSVPALAQMGQYSGDNRYFDDAVKQVIQFSDRMFNHEKGLYMHAYIIDMKEHPQFHWGRANGWAIMTMVELLEVLPEDYKGRDKVLEYLQKHIYGLSQYQSGSGFWHQLLDRNDSYLETSATAIFTYSIARAINRGYVDAKAYGPMVCLAWNAIASKVNARGQVEGTCVGTGMGFDPAFYYYRPVNVYAAHGYGPVLLAGAEMITLLDQNYPKMNDSAVQFYNQEINTDEPIFSEQ